MLHASTTRRTSFLCMWLLPLCLLFCGAARTADPAPRCHRPKPAEPVHCPNQIGPAPCAAADFDIPKPAPLLSSLPRHVSEPVPEMTPEPVIRAEVERTRDRLALHRLLRI